MTCFHESLVKCTGSLNANWSSCRAGAAVDGLPNNTSGELASTSAISATQDEEVILLQKTAKPGITGYSYITLLVFTTVTSIMMPLKSERSKFRLESCTVCIPGVHFEAASVATISVV